MTKGEKKSAADTNEIFEGEKATIALKIATDLTDKPSLIDEEILLSQEIKMETVELSHWYGDHRVLSGISIPIFKNKVTAIIGPSGCGKSTFLRDLNRMNDLVPISRISGTVLLDSQNIYEPNIDIVKLRTRVGMVFQKPNPFPMSIEDNVAYGPYIHGIKHNDIIKIVERSLKKAVLWEEVSDRLKNNALSLSGGQQQRLCIARALSVEPEVILFDEPCSALDPYATAKIEDLITKLKQDYTVVIVTHNMQQAARVSDYTAFFNLGELIEFNTTKKIFQAPERKMTEEYISGRFG
ncbi:MAG: phosphate ABC transporter ATP-binding protein [Candidatus Heimdallarchaeota archaeon]|nr:phosphate ABC transporter ATP-binding protein [Candidatus Heimdallarchaeota archaeon]